MPDDYGVPFGFPAEWAHFSETHQLFFDRFRNLQAALALAFVRKGQASEPVDRVVFFIGRVCVEDFLEILLLCANGYGLGGLKILRSMYERAVTARYLHSHPEETDNFWAFHWVSWYKLSNAIRDTFGANVLSEEQIAKIKTKRDEVLGRFMVPACDKCGTKRPNHTWSKLDLVSMAKAAGSLGQLIIPGYYLPMREAHATVAAMLSRLREGEGGGLDFDEGPQRDRAHETLMTAHNLILDVLDLQKDHFELDSLGDALQTCRQDFMDIWGNKPEQEDPTARTL